ncbi:hypothetical protein HGA89_06380 [bacterium]|nr:hypothetical protein [bacterium]
MPEAVRVGVVAAAGSGIGTLVVLKAGKTTRDVARQAVRQLVMGHDPRLAEGMVVDPQTGRVSWTVGSSSGRS